MVFGQLGPGQDKWAPIHLGSGQMGTRTNGSQTNGSGLGLGQRNNCPGPICTGTICPRIVAHNPQQSGALLRNALLRTILRKTLRTPLPHDCNDLPTSTEPFKTSGNREGKFLEALF